MLTTHLIKFIPIYFADNNFGKNKSNKNSHPYLVMGRGMVFFSSNSQQRFVLLFAGSVQYCVVLLSTELKPFHFYRKFISPFLVVALGCGKYNKILS